MIKDIIFANPIIEKQFRGVVNARTDEIGGWFFVNLDPVYWMSRYPFQYREFVTASGIEDPYFVNGFIVAPNQSEKNQKYSYRPWDWDRAKELAIASSNAIGCFAISFHTHPGGPNTPSQNDIAISARYDSNGSDTAWFVIVTTYPLRLWPYELTWNRNNPKNTHLVHGKFTSWRSNKLNKYDSLFRNPHLG